MMNACLHVLRNGLLSLALLGAIGGPTSATAQSVSSEEAVRSVQRMLERLRNSIGVHHGMTVPNLTADAGR